MGQHACNFNERVNLLFGTPVHRFVYPRLQTIIQQCMCRPIVCPRSSPLALFAVNPALHPHSLPTNVSTLARTSRSDKLENELILMKQHDVSPWETHCVVRATHDK